MLPLALLLGVGIIAALAFGKKAGGGAGPHYPPGVLPTPGPGPSPGPSPTPASGPSGPIGTLLPAGSTANLVAGDTYLLVLQASDYDPSGLQASDWQALGLQQGDWPGYVATVLDSHFFPNGAGDWTPTGFDSASYPGYLLVSFQDLTGGTAGGQMMSAFSLTDTSQQPTAGGGGDGEGTSGSGDASGASGAGDASGASGAGGIGMGAPYGGGSSSGGSFGGGGGSPAIGGSNAGVYGLAPSGSNIFGTGTQSVVNAENALISGSLNTGLAAPVARLTSHAVAGAHVTGKGYVPPNRRGPKHAGVPRVSRQFVGNNTQGRVIEFRDPGSRGHAGNRFGPHDDELD